MATGLEVTCSQCGGRLTVDPTRELTGCEHCDSTLYLDICGAIPHYYVEPTLAIRTAGGHVARFLAAHDVAPVHEVSSVELFFLPIWGLERGSESRWLPAAATLSLDTDCLEFPPGARKVVRTELVERHRFERPTIELDAALAQWGVDPPRPSAANRVSLTHIPLLGIEYSHGDRPYELLVNAVTGAASAIEVPPPRSHAFNARSAAAMTAVVALFTVESAVLPGLGAPLVAGGVTALVIRWWLQERMQGWMNG